MPKYLETKISIRLSDLIALRAALINGVECFEDYERTGAIHALSRDFFLDGAKRAIKKLEAKKAIKLLLESQDMMSKVD